MHELAVVVAATSVHVGVAKLPPAFPLLQTTVPVGALGTPLLVSITVTV